MLTKRTSRQHDESALGAVFAAVADPTRRAILSRLARGPATVTQLAEPFAISLPAVSKHLKVLEAAGLLERTIVGREHHCRAVPETLLRAEAWIAERSAFWDEALGGLRRFLGEPTPGAAEPPGHERGLALVRRTPDDSWTIERVLWTESSPPHPPRR